jgi:UDP-N-acetylglucosamine acyltransferase
MAHSYQEIGTNIHPSAQIGNNVTLGLNVTIEAGAVIQDDCILDSNSYVGRDSIIGKGCHLFPGAVIGTAPQDLNYKDEFSRAILGNGVQVREYATVHRASGEGQETIVGDGCLLMAYSHVGHNSRLGQNVILANAVQLGGYTEIGDFSNLGGGVVVHQFVRIGRLVMVSGNCATRQDLPPFAIADGHLACLRGINTIGLKRKGISSEIRKKIKIAYKLLWDSNLPQAKAIEQIQQQFPEEPMIEELIHFIHTSKRGIRRRHSNTLSIE